MLNFYPLVWAAVQIFVIACHAASIQKELEGSGHSTSFPKALTTDNFYETIKHGLHLVEFFSPFCSHCVRFGPIWEKTWEEFHEEGEKLGIRMSQVNCMESGDICSQEGIHLYPSISLYGESGFLQSYPLSYERSTPDLIRFMKEEASEQENFEELVHEVASLQLDKEKLETYLQGKGEKPIVISFWPPSEKDTDEAFAPMKDCRECPFYQRIWKRLAYKLGLQGIPSGHFNIMEDTQFIQKYKLDSLDQVINGKGDLKPAIAVVLPSVHHNIVFYEDEVASASKLVKFVNRVISNYKKEGITEKQVQDMIMKPIEIHDMAAKENSDLLYLVLDSRSRDRMSQTPGLLEEIIQSLSKYENLYFYCTESDLMPLLKENYGLLLQELQDSVVKIDFSIFEGYFNAITSTEDPRIYLFKQGSMVPNVYYGPVGSSLPKNILKWVDENTMPAVSEIKGRNYLKLLNYKNDYYEKLVIQLVDTATFDTRKISMQYLNNLLGIMNKFDVIRFECKYHTIVSHNPDNLLVDNFKHLVQKGQFKDDHKVLYAYLDLKHNRKMVDRLGLNAQRKKLKAGDVLIVDKIKAKHYYATDRWGKSLTAEIPDALCEMLAYLVFSDLYKDKSIRKILINSPFGDSLRFLDSIHEHGILGWLLTVVVGFFLFQLMKYCYKKGRKRSSYVAKRDVVGLLGSKKLKD